MNSENAVTESVYFAWHHIFDNTLLCQLYELLKDVTLNIATKNPFLMQFMPLEKIKNTNLLQIALQTKKS